MSNYKQNKWTKTIIRTQTRTAKAARKKPPLPTEQRNERKYHQHYFVQPCDFFTNHSCTVCAVFLFICLAMFSVFCIYVYLYQSMNAAVATMAVRFHSFSPSIGMSKASGTFICSPFTSVSHALFSLYSRCEKDLFNSCDTTDWFVCC